MRCRRVAGKQLRERYNHHLDPNLSKSPYTAEEDAVLVVAHAQLGNRWSLIRLQLPGRSETSLKSRMTSITRMSAKGGGGKGPSQARESASNTVTSETERMPAMSISEAMATYPNSCQSTELSLDQSTVLSEVDDDDDDLPYQIHRSASGSDAENILPSENVLPSMDVWHSSPMIELGGGTEAFAMIHMEHSTAGVGGPMLDFDVDRELDAF